MFGDILQPTHLLFIFVVALLVLGPKRLPEVGRSLGKGLRDFRGAMSGIEDQARDVFDPGEITTNTPATATPEPPPVVSSPAPVVSSPAPVVSSPVPVATEAVAHEPHPDEYAD